MPFSRHQDMLMPAIARESSEAVKSHEHQLFGIKSNKLNSIANARCLRSVQGLQLRGLGLTLF
jgi:hypothetical protein